MKRIHKYPLVAGVIGRQSISLPAGARVLTAQVQHGVIYLWAEVDTDETSEELREVDTDDTDETSEELREFVIHGTGDDMLDHLHYIDTVQLDGGYLVFHVYERRVEQ